MLKKDVEFHWLERARDIRPDLLSGELTVSEAPDFLVLRSGRRIGIEVTRYFSAPRAADLIPEEQSGLRRKVLAVAKRQFSERSTTRLRVGVIFNSTPALRSRRVPAIASAIVEYLMTRLNGSPDWSRLRWTSDDAPLPAELSRLYATVVPSAANTHWYPADAGWIWQADYDGIARIVATKESKVSKYRERCDELMLLIVFEGRPQGSRAAHAPLEPVEFSIDTGFDSVFCLDVLEKRLVEVPIARIVA